MAVHHVGGWALIGVSSYCQGQWRCWAFRSPRPGSGVRLKLQASHTFVTKAENDQVAPGQPSIARLKKEIPLWHFLFQVKFTKREMTLCKVNNSAAFSLFAGVV